MSIYFAPAGVAKQALNGLAGELYRSASSKLTKQLKLWTTQKGINTLYRRLSDVRMVKTLWPLLPESLRGAAFSV